VVGCIGIEEKGIIVDEEQLHVPICRTDFEM
jgi:hypothetical protein